MEQLHRYFDGERQAGMLAAALGVASIAFAVWLFRSGSPFRAMWIPLALVGLAQLGVGIGLNVRTGPQVAALVDGLDETHEETKRTEIARMDRVVKNFAILKLVWIVLMAVSVGLIMTMRSRPAAVGVGMALVVEAAVMLAFDVFAEARADVYLSWLRSSA
jgi:hypothetical protein